MGDALGIEGSDKAAPTTPRWRRSSRYVNGGLVSVDWGWEGYRTFLDQCELQVDRSDSHGFVMLAIDTTPGYTDTQPFPAAPAKWSYQAIYRRGDKRVGQWSSPCT